jgi:pimeloyl-ACP methyl ester carboxylesterase
VVALVDWAREQANLQLPIGLFGASTGAAAALVAATIRPANISAVVSRGGRPDLAGLSLPHVIAPTLLLVGSLDAQVLELNRQAGGRMRAVTRLELVTGATHLFEEPGTLEHVGERAGDWFVQYFREDQGGDALHRDATALCHSPEGNVSATSPSSHNAVRSSGSTARVSSMWTT